MSPAPVYKVVIYPNEDNAGGYWAKCPIDEKGCAFTDGKTIMETEINMFESVSLMLRDINPGITDYSLAFTLADKPYDE
jgi:predicted RNase H-like HicB family nuclease